MKQTILKSALLLSSLLAVASPARATCYEAPEAKLSFDDKDRRDVRVLLNWDEQRQFGDLIMTRDTSHATGVSGISCDIRSGCQISDDGNAKNQVQLIFAAGENVPGLRKPAAGDSVKLQMRLGELFAAQYEPLDPRSERFVAVGEADADHTVTMTKVEAAVCAPFITHPQGEGPGGTDSRDADPYGEATAAGG